MSNRRRIRRATNTTYGYPPVRSQSPSELWDRLVADGVRRIPTPLAWMVDAIEAVARSKRTTPEKVFVELDETVRARCGRGLTIEPGVL